MFENLATATGSKSTPSRKGDTSAVMSAQARLGTTVQYVVLGTIFTRDLKFCWIQEKVSLWLPTQVPRVQPVAQQSGREPLASAPY